MCSISIYIQTYILFVNNIMGMISLQQLTVILFENSFYSRLNLNILHHCTIQ